jgi:hypothetical protein
MDQRLRFHTEAGFGVEFVHQPSMCQEPNSEDFTLLDEWLVAQTYSAPVYIPDQAEMEDPSGKVANLRSVW